MLLYFIFFSFFCIIYIFMSYKVLSIEIMDFVNIL